LLEYVSTVKAARRRHPRARPTPDAGRRAAD
jgi:hypothetical protein